MTTPCVTHHDENALAAPAWLSSARGAARQRPESQRQRCTGGGKQTPCTSSASGTQCRPAGHDGERRCHGSLRAGRWCRGGGWATSRGRGAASWASGSSSHPAARHAQTQLPLHCLLLLTRCMILVVFVLLMMMSLLSLLLPGQRRSPPLCWCSGGASDAGRSSHRGICCATFATPPNVIVALRVEAVAIALTAEEQRWQQRRR